MEKQNKSSHFRLIMVSSMYIVLALSMFTISVYAWFTLTDTNSANLVSSVTGVEAEYEFYIYQNSEHDGSNELTLIDNFCTVAQDKCYQYIPNPIYPHLIDGKVAPGETFSFAIKLRSIGASDGKLELSLGGLQSIGYDLPINKIQQAFRYEVTKISYIEAGVESTDQKDNFPIEYHNQAFDLLTNNVYPLVRNVPFGIANHQRSILVIYFDITFDPTIYGEDEYGVPYTNSNIFMNQTFIINHIYMTIS